MFYSVIKALGYPLFHLLFLFRVRYIGKENMPKEGPVIVCCNHLFALDPCFLIAMFRRKISFMAKEELFRHKFANWFLRKMKVFPVSRNEADVDAVKTSLRTLKNGEVLGIFPEGHRQQEGRERDVPHGGTVMFAAKTKATILPVTITGTNGRVRLFHKVIVKCGKPIPYEELGLVSADKAEYNRVSAEIMAQIYKTKDELDA